MKLSILICAIEERREQFHKIYRHVFDQIKKEELMTQVELLFDMDNRQKPVGQKRMELVQQAKGEYVVFIDDDDWVSNDYVKEMYNTLARNPNVDNLAIQGIITTNGANPKQWYISNKHTWHEKNGEYYRPPNHITAVKRQHALKVGFPFKNNGEDYDYCMSLVNGGYCNREAKIDRNIYFYRFDTNKTATQK